MEAKKIEVVKEQPKSKSVQDIQVFLDFANFYQQFIQGFSKMAVLLTSMLKTIVLPKKLMPKQLRVGNNKIDRFGVDDSVEYTKKSEKTSKS